MEYRKLGNTSLKVSVISYGNWLNAEFPEQIAQNEKVIKKCWDLGINFFDTAEIYGRGEAEKQLGQAIRNLGLPREDLVITTKVYFGTNEKNPPNSQFLSRKHIIEGLKASLQRLQMSYVDVFYAHRCDPDTPMEEICRAFDWCVRKGLAIYWATSEWSPQEIMEAYGVCDRLGLHKPVCEQPQYNLYTRDLFEHGYEYIFEHFKMGATVWSPLLQGLLSGKYNNGIEHDGRLGNVESIKDNNPTKTLISRFFSEDKKEHTLAALRGLGEIAKQLGCTQAQLAMAWVIRNPDVSTAITGFSRVEQADDIMGAIDVQKKITKEIENRIDQLFGTKPQTVFDFISGSFKKTRREKNYD